MKSNRCYINALDFRCGGPLACDFSNVEHGTCTHSIKSPTGTLCGNLIANKNCLNQTFKILDDEIMARYSKE